MSGRHRILREMVLTYAHEYEFLRDTTRLIEGGASLHDLYQAWLSAPDRNLDVSPELLRHLASRWTQRPNFVPIRLQELFEGRELEHSDDYVLALVGHLGGRWYQAVRLLMLRHDHALRDGVFWRIFEVEGGGEISLANIDKFSGPDLNWHHTVLQLSNEGTLPRPRVLRACLQALNRDFSAYRAGWFSRVYAALAPTPAEAAADQELLCLCLGTGISATQSLAMQQLAAVHKAGLLQAEAFVQACGPVFSGPKGSALLLVKLLLALGTAQKVDSDAWADVLAMGLGHPHADVQRAAAKALQQLGHDAQVQAQRDALAPSVVAELLPASSPSPHSESSAELPAAPESALLAQPLVPWTDDEATERYALLLESPSDAPALELALAWLALAPPAALQQLQPLAKRAQRLREKDGLVNYSACLLLAALSPGEAFLPANWHTRLENGEWMSQPEEEVVVLPSFIARLREVAAIVQSRSPRRPLLATPTDSLGWLDLDVLLSRWAAQPQSAPALPADQHQALLRVKPEDRARAAQAMGLPLPHVSQQLTLREPGPNRPNWAWLSSSVTSEASSQPSALNAGFIPSGFNGGRSTRNMLIAQLGLSVPESTLPLVAFSHTLLVHTLHGDVEHEAPNVLMALARHPGRWTAETAQLVALGMAAHGHHAQVRVLAVELFAAAIPARVDVATATQAFAACTPAVLLPRWAIAFADAANLAPLPVISVLTHLLPSLDVKAKGLASLMQVLLDESLRHEQWLDHPPLRDWLAGFSGGTAAAKLAKALQARQA